MTLTARNAEDFRAIFHDDFDEAPTPRQRHLHASQLRQKELARNHPDEPEYDENALIERLEDDK